MSIERNFLLFAADEEAAPGSGKRRIIGIGAYHDDGHYALALHPTLLRFEAGHTGEIDMGHAALRSFMYALPIPAEMAWATERFSPENTEVSFTDEKGALVASWSRDTGLIAHSLRVVEGEEAEPWMLGQEERMQEEHEVSE